MKTMSQKELSRAGYTVHDALAGAHRKWVVACAAACAKDRSQT